MRGRGKLIHIMIISLVLLFSMLLMVDSSHASEIKWSLQKQIREERNETAIVITSQFDSTLRKDFLDNNQFELSDSLTFARFYIVDSTKDVPFTAIMIKSPSDNRTVYDLDEIPASDLVPISYKARGLDVFDSLRFDEEGVWTIKFHLDKSNVYLYEFDGFFTKFDESSNVIPLSGAYKGLEILSPSVVQQIKVGKTSESLLTWQIIGIIITFCALVATAFMVILTGKSVNESLKEKRRYTSIVPIIVDGIDNFAKSEFNWLNSCIAELKQGKIIVLPSSINSSDLTDAIWRDFRREYPDIFTRLEAYVKLKEDYSIRYKQLIDCIGLALDDFRKQQPNFDKEMQKIIKKRYPHDPLNEFYSNRVKPSLIYSIRNNENKITHSEIHNLFDKFSTSLLKIRRTGAVKNLIDELLGYVKQFENYTNLKEILVDKKEELMRKYNLYDGDLEVYYRENYP